MAGQILNYGSVIASGKTKDIVVNGNNPSTVFMQFRDDITAGDGAKHDVVEGKAMLDWQVNKNIFELLARKGVPTHYINSPMAMVALVHRLQTKINLEVVSRRVATGSILQRDSSVTEGDYYKKVTVEFYYKDDGLHDPKLDDAHIEALIANKKNGWWWVKMKEINHQVFAVLESAFAHFGIQLVDFKLEYGIVHNEILLIDEITGGSFRLWPFAEGVTALNGTNGNVMDQLNPKGRLDKDIYRHGGSLDEQRNKFAQIAAITAQFKDLP